MDDILKKLLDLSNINYLPKFNVIDNETYQDIYIHSVDVKKFFSLVKELDLDPNKLDKFLIKNYDDKTYEIVNKNNKDTLLDYYENIKNKIIIKDIDNRDKFINLLDKMKSVNLEINDLFKEINKENLRIKNFKCNKGIEKMNDHIVNCSKLSNKDINWYHIVLHLDKT